MLRVFLLISLLAFGRRSECIGLQGDLSTETSRSQTYPVSAAGTPDPRSPIPSVLDGMRRVDRFEVSSRIDEGSDQEPFETSGRGQPAMGPKRVLTVADVQPLLREVLAKSGDQLNLKILELSRFPLPPGTLQFRRDGATPPPVDRPDSSFVWRGTFTAEDGRAYSFWVRLQASISSRAVCAKTDLRAGQIISEKDIEECEARICPLSPHVVASMDIYKGRIVRRSLQAGTTLRPTMVQDPPRVVHGTLVSVLVHSGSAQLAFKALANANGRPGQRISLTNLESHRSFVGTVLDDGTVSVEAAIEPDSK
jgi:flagella basal body P-ring formation protein FlgA